MKRYINTVIFLSVSGALLSALLLYQHYFPDSDLGLLSCSKGPSNPCITVGQSEYSVFLGIPVAAFGLMYFILITFITLVADYAGDKYYKILCGILLPLTAAGLISDLILGILMIRIGELCRLCAATYLVNIVIFIVLLMFIRKNFIKKDILESLKSFFNPSGSDQKASLSLSILFSFFLAFTVLTSANVIKMKSGADRNTDARKSEMLSGFYKQKPETINYIPSSLYIGKPDAKLKIYIFNDFLCSACYKLFQIEKFIIPKYKNKIQIIYYHYPLDKACNRFMNDTIYKNSCTASQTMHAAAESGFFEEYLFSHFMNYSSYHDGFGKDNIIKNIEQAEKQFRIRAGAKQKFESLLEVKGGNSEIAAHIEFAEKLKIDATPTIIISGRKIVGVPPKELLESIIETELSK